MVAPDAPGSRGSGNLTDLILHNANVYTLDDAHPHASALAVRGEHIAHVGGDEAVLASATPNATIVDLELTMVRRRRRTYL